MKVNITTLTHQRRKADCINKVQVNKAIGGIKHDKN